MAARRIAVLLGIMCPPLIMRLIFLAQQRRQQLWKMRTFEGFDTPPTREITLSYDELTRTYAAPREARPMPVVIMTTAHRFEYLADVIDSIGVATAGLGTPLRTCIFVIDLRGASNVTLNKLFN